MQTFDCAKLLPNKLNISWKMHMLYVRKCKYKWYNKKCTCMLNVLMSISTSFLCDGGVSMYGHDNFFIFFFVPLVLRSQCNVHDTPHCNFIIFIIINFISKNRPMWRILRFAICDFFFDQVFIHETINYFVTHII